MEIFPTAGMLISALLAANLDIGIFAYYSRTSDLDDKTKYTTLSRCFLAKTIAPTTPVLKNI